MWAVALFRAYTLALVVANEPDRVLDYISLTMVK
jgi:hypothetical protein